MYTILRRRSMHCMHFVCMSCGDKRVPKHTPFVSFSSTSRSPSPLRFSLHFVLTERSRFFALFHTRRRRIEVFVFFFSFVFFLFYREHIQMLDKPVLAARYTRIREQARSKILQHHCTPVRFLFFFFLYRAVVILVIFFVRRFARSNASEYAKWIL